MTTKLGILRTNMFKDQLIKLARTRSVDYMAGYLESTIITMFAELPAAAQHDFLHQLGKTNASVHILPNVARAHIINAMHNEG